MGSDGMDPSDGDTPSTLGQEKECFLEEQLSQSQQGLSGRENTAGRGRVLTAAMGSQWRYHRQIQSE